MLTTIAQILAVRAIGEKASDSDIQAALTKRDRLPQPSGGGVAVLPVHGVLIPRATLMSEMSGATSIDALSSDLRDALANDQVNTIVLDVDSPGGSVAGVTEFAQELMRARTRKPIVAVAKYTMASAAYWIASAATEIVASPSSVVGSVGVYTIHDDFSKALEHLGIKRTHIAAGKFKTEGNTAEPLSDDAKATMQKRVDDWYGRFVKAISQGRGVSVEQVRDGYGEGRVVSADEALSLGMVDRVATLDETIARVAKAAPSRAMQTAAQADDAWRARMELELLAL